MRLGTTTAAAAAGGGSASAATEAGARTVDGAFGDILDDVSHPDPSQSQSATAAPKPARFGSTVPDDQSISRPVAALQNRFAATAAASQSDQAPSSLSRDASSGTPSRQTASAPDLLELAERASDRDVSDPPPSASAPGDEAPSAAASDTRSPMAAALGAPTTQLESRASDTQRPREGTPGQDGDEPLTATFVGAAAAVGMAPAVAPPMGVPGTIASDRSDAASKIVAIASPSVLRRAAGGAPTDPDRATLPAPAAAPSGQSGQPGTIDGAHDAASATSAGLPIPPGPKPIKRAAAGSETDAAIGVALAPGFAHPTIAATFGGESTATEPANVSVAMPSPPAVDESASEGDRATTDPEIPGASVDEALGGPVHSGDAAATTSPATTPVLVTASPAAVAGSIVSGSVRFQGHLGFSRMSGRGPASAVTHLTDDDSTPISPSSSEGATGGTSDVATRHTADGFLSAIATPGGETAGAPPRSASPDASPAAIATIVAGAGLSPQSMSSGDGPPVTRQVADGLASLAQSAATPATAGSIAPARTMILQLSPAGLGTVSVRLHVSGSALDVRLETTESRTANLIDRDRAALASALSDHSYQLTSLSVTTSDPQRQGAIHAEPGAETRSNDDRSFDPSRDDNQSNGGAPRQDARGDRRDERPAQSAPDEPFGRRGASSLFV